MKKTLLTSGLLLAGISLFAQQPHHFSPFKKATPSKQQKLVQSLLEKQLASSAVALKPTGMQQRVIAQTSIDGDSGLEDSITYKYSGTRTSKYNHNTIMDEPIYASEFTSDYLSGPIADFVGKSTDMQADTISFYDDQNAISSISKAFYRNDNKIDSFVNVDLSGGTLYTINATRHAFNSGGNITAITNMVNMSNPLVLDTMDHKKLFYNTAGTQLLRDSSMSFNGTSLVPSYATLYFYNSQNNLDSLVELNENAGTYYASTKNKIEYDANNRLTRIIGYNYDENGASQGQFIFTFAYNGNSPYYTKYEESYIDNNDTSTDVTIKTLGANNLPDTIKKGFYDNGIFEADIVFKYHYNTYNNPDSLMGYDSDGEYLGQYNFYYQTYDDGNNVGIKNTKANNSFNIYPNPFDNKINIDWKATTTTAKISLINMVGQKVCTLNTTLSNGNNSIDLPATASGNYILMIQDEKGNTYNQKLSKR